MAFVSCALGDMFISTRVMEELRNMEFFVSHDVQDTEALGEGWGRTCRRGLVLGLSGELGAGKTHLVKGIARGLGIRSVIQSPTFALVNEYSEGRLPLCHLDLYRLETIPQIQSAGLDSYLDRPDAIVIVEWIERWIPTLRDPGFRSRAWHPQLCLVHIQSLDEQKRLIFYEDFRRDPVSPANP